MITKVRIGFLASHNGSGMRAVAAAVRQGRLAAEPAVLISNNSGSGALQWARAEGVAARHLSERTHADPVALDLGVLHVLSIHGADTVVLSGYMKKLGPRTLAVYGGRTLNIHPALLPKFGGPGMYGDRVHAAVVASGERESGVTVHLVDAEYDHGPVVAQCRVPVMPEDTPGDLGARVRAREGPFLVEVLQGIAQGRPRLRGPGGDGPPPEVRRALPSDRLAVQAVAWATWGHAYRERIAEGIQRAVLARAYGVDSLTARLGGGAFFVADAGGVIGFAEVRRPTPAERYVAALYVLPWWQRTGLGRRLLSAALAGGDGRVRVHVVDGNAPAQRFYEALGFREVRSLEQAEGPHRVPVRELVRSEDT